MLPEISYPEQDAFGLPKDKSYLECGLPPFLQVSVEAMKQAWYLRETYLRIERG